MVEAGFLQHIMNNDTTFPVHLIEIRDELLKASYYSLDLETTGLEFEKDRITVISVATKNGGWAIRITEDDGDCPLRLVHACLKPIFEDSEKICVQHNSSFDTQMLAHKGIFLKNRIRDTMIMSWLIKEDRKTEGGHGLKNLALLELNHEMTSYDQARSLFGNFTDYATDDAITTLRLYKLFYEKLERLDLIKWLDEIEMPIARILIEVEINGVCLDPEKLKQLKRQAADELEQLADEACKLAGYKFEVGSAAQWGRLLFDELRIGTRSDKTNIFSMRGKKKPHCKICNSTGRIDSRDCQSCLGPWGTSDDVIKAIVRHYAKLKAEADTKGQEFSEENSKAYKLAKLLLKYREVSTRNNTFIKPLLERAKVNRIIHPKFKQIGTITGRFASEDPNYQNLPRDGGVRAAFIARPGKKIIRADFSQAELRLMAHMSQDPTMLAIYRNKGDIHSKTAAACGVSRQAAKAINFGLIYRMSANRLRAQLALEGIEVTVEQCQDYVKKYFGQYSRVREFHRKVEGAVLQRANKEGFGWIKTLGGRYRRIPKDVLDDPEKSYPAITQFINTTIQGGVSDLVKYAMVQIQNEFKRRGWLDPEKGIWRATLSGQVHDEVFAEVDEEIAEEAAKIIQFHMEDSGRVFKISVPMTSDALVVDSLAKE